MQDNRKKEIEKKKQKLAELKKARADRQASLLLKQNITPLAQRQNIDELVNQLIGKRSTFLQQQQQQQIKPQQQSYVNDFVNEPQSEIKENVIPLDLDHCKPKNDNEPALMTSEDFVIFEMPPAEKVCYEKEVQTNRFSDDENEDYDSNSENENYDVLVSRKSNSLLKGKETFGKLKDEEDVEADNISVKSVEKKDSNLKLREMSDGEKKLVLASENFQNFFDSSSKLIERALNDISDYDFMIDYTASEEALKETDTGGNLKLVSKFFDERWSKNRTVTSLAWSPKYQELLLSSYNKNPMATNDPDGVVLIWNQHLTDRPEFIFHAQSDVMAACFSEFHPNYIIGGTFSGQILIWDTRAKNRLPDFKSTLTGGHTNPVFSLQTLGTQNSNHLVSASNDGLVCTWQLDMFGQPMEALELVHQSHPKTDEVAVTCFEFPFNETSMFLVGTEEGNIYQANKYDRAGSKAGISSTEVYKSHQGMVTSLQFHPVNGTQDFTDIFLTSSIDWQVKLWRQKSLATSTTQMLSNTNNSGINSQRHSILDNLETSLNIGSGATAQSSSHIIKPIANFDNSDDYVFDCKWSPTHPSVFGTCDASGKFDLYNLNVETEVPVASVKSVGTGKALNKVAWNKDGKKVALGSIDGFVYVYDVGEYGQPTPQDSLDFQRTLHELESQL
ncbi:hypothetical protein HDU92_003125 [Lobulomyces angularis]|nr:hypothetical protein HDU92_003125 [Lobulomyces angularis]